MALAALPNGVNVVTHDVADEAFKSLELGSVTHSHHGNSTEATSPPEGL